MKATKKNKSCSCLEQRDKLINQMLKAFMRLGYSDRLGCRIAARIYASAFWLKAERLGVKVKR